MKLINLFVRSTHISIYLSVYLSINLLFSIWIQLFFYIVSSFFAKRWFQNRHGFWLFLSGSEVLWKIFCSLKRKFRVRLFWTIKIFKYFCSPIEAPERVFSCVGLDFAGPLTLKSGNECVKGCVAFFICFSSKAVHLEAVSSLTTAVCVAALRWFIARRGIPSQIVSDNATIFVGSRRDLNELKQLVQAGAQSYSSNEWLFIPPRSPNFGGLWEAAVKSMKHNLRRVIGISILTYYSLSTILCQREHVFNNRPLMALTNNPDDIFALTPSILVHGSRLDAIPQRCLQKMDAHGHPVNQFCALQELLSQFWKQWSSEYVASLQLRGKWRQERANLSVDDVVLITDECILPLQWSIGRVMQLKLGHDGFARVALVRISPGEFTKLVSELRRLPIKDNDFHNANVKFHAYNEYQHELQWNCVQWRSG